MVLCSSGGKKTGRYIIVFALKSFIDDQTLYQQFYAQVTLILEYIRITLYYSSRFVFFRYKKITQKKEV